MNESLRHRGPDGAGVHLCKPAGRVGLAHTRLAVIDLHTGGQPMCNEDGTVWVTCNGEIYNHRELRRELEARGHVFRSQSDTESLVHLYEEMGAECVSRLVGMFAFAIWDERKGEMTLARDRLGQKPLFWMTNNDRLVFASESRAIQALGDIPRELDPLAMDFYLRLWYVPAPHSIWQGVRQLPPATIMTWRLGQGAQPVREFTYWEPPAAPTFAGEPEEACEELRRLLRQAVRVRTMSDVPLGVFLSGGLDSTLIVSLLAEAGTTPLKTFSLGFPEAEYNELPFARKVAKMYETDHTEFVLDATSIDNVESLAALLDEPFGDSSALPTYEISRQARPDIAVALTGEAGDENFGGYLRYAPLTRTESIYKRTDWWRHRVFGRILDWKCHWRVTPLKMWLTHRLCKPDDLYFRLMSVFSDAHLERLYTPDTADRIDRDAVRSWFCGIFEKGIGHGGLGAAMHADLLSYLPGDLNVKLDRASMAVGLEARSPFQDHRLVEFASSLPAAWKMRQASDGTLIGKALLKQAYHKRIPQPLLDRPKMGFALPLRKWFAGPWAERARQVLLDASTLRRCLLRREGIERIIHQHVSGCRDHSQRLWQMLFLELWMRHHLDTPPPVRNSAPRHPARAEQLPVEQRIPVPA